jgi:hypothetical protein
MKLSTKGAILGFLVHTGIYLCVLTWYLLQDGEHQIGICGFMGLFDLPVSRLPWWKIPWSHLFQRFDTVDIYMYLVSLPLGGAWYAFIGWWVGYFVSRKRREILAVRPE